MEIIKRVLTVSIALIITCVTAIVLTLTKPGWKEELPVEVVYETYIAEESELPTETALAEETDWFEEHKSSNPVEYTVITPTGGYEYLTLEEDALEDSEWLNDITVFKYLFEDGEVEWDVTPDQVEVMWETYRVDENFAVVKFEFTAERTGEVSTYEITVDRNKRAIYGNF